MFLQADDIMHVTQITTSANEFFRERQLKDLFER